MSEQEQAEWRQQLEELRDGPYAGRGGRKALAADLGVPVSTLTGWLGVDKWARVPEYENRGKIRRLWESHGLGRKG